MLWPAWLRESCVPVWHEVRAQLKENKNLRALAKWFWMILCQLWLLVTKPLLALIPPSRRKCVTQNSTSAAQDRTTVHQNTHFLLLDSLWGKQSCSYMMHLRYLHLDDTDDKSNCWEKNAKHLPSRTYGMAVSGTAYLALKSGVARTVSAKAVVVWLFFFPQSTAEYC